MNYLKLLLPLVFTSLPAIVIAQERSKVVQQLSPTGGDVAHALGLDLYKFRLPVRSEHFRVLVRERLSAGGEATVLSTHDFEADRGYEKFDLLLSFLPEDGIAPHALLQGGELVDLEIQCRFGNATTGSRTLIPRPLMKSHGGTRSIRPMNLRADDKTQGEDEVVLLLIGGKENDGFTPTAEVVISYASKAGG